MKRYIKGLILSAYFFSLASCSNDIPMEVISKKDSKNVEVAKLKRLSKGIFDLSENDAEIVAKLYNKKNKSTRAFEDQDIKEIIPIKNEKGETLIYAVNFTDGYIFVSASKKYYPILAMIDHGSYKTNHEAFGEDVIVHDMLNMIELCKKDTTLNPKVAYEWERFEEYPSSLSTRADINCPTEEEYQIAYDDLLFDVTEATEGILRKLTDCKNILPEEIYKSYCSRAEGFWDDLYGGTKYSWEHTAMVAEYINDIDEEYGSYLTTKWDQNFDYTTENPGGCVTIATGQLMKYFRFPTNINWNAMSDSYMNTATCDFLKDLRVMLKISDTGSGYLSEAAKVLSGYGYNCTVISHNPTEVYKSLAQKKPVSQSGVVPGKTVGHNWICDGYRYHKPGKRYVLYCLGFSETNPDELVYRRAEYDPYIEWINTGLTYFHNVWGWGGYYDGWYLDNLSRMPSDMQYTTKRSDLIVNSIN